MTSRVGIVGYEAVTPLGLSWDKTRQSLLNGEVGPNPVTIHGRGTCLGRIELDPPENDRIPRYHQIAREAIVNYLNHRTSVPDAALGVVAATSKGGAGDMDVRSMVDLHNPGIWSGRIASAFPQSTRVSSPNTACATGLTSLIHASRWIKHGEVDQAIVIASESNFNPLLVAGYQNMNALCDEDGMRPFDPNRTGFALSEGAAMVHLWGDRLINENPDRVLGYVTSWGESNDAHHITDMEAEGRGLNDAIQTSLADVAPSRTDVDLLHAHLTTTEANDQVEEKIITGWPSFPLLQGIKPALGHTIGGAGLIEAIATVDVLNGTPPFPIANIDDRFQQYRNPEADDYEFGLTWNMGFGGHNACVLLQGA